MPPGGEFSHKRIETARNFQVSFVDGRPMRDDHLGQQSIGRIYARGRKHYPAEYRWLTQEISEAPTTSDDSNRPHVFRFDSKACAVRFASNDSRVNSLGDERFILALDPFKIGLEWEPPENGVSVQPVKFGNRAVAIEDIGTDVP